MVLTAPWIVGSVGGPKLPGQEGQTSMVCLSAGCPGLVTAVQTVSFCETEATTGNRFGLATRYGPGYRKAA